MKTANRLKSIFWFEEPSYRTEFSINDPSSATAYDVRDEKPPEKDVYVTDSIDESLSYIKQRFSYPLNNDVVIRELRLKKGRRAFVIFIDGMVNTDHVDEAVI